MVLLRQIHDRTGNRKEGLVVHSRTGRKARLGYDAPLATITGQAVMYDMRRGVQQQRACTRAWSRSSSASAATSASLRHDHPGPILPVKH
jgi:hypothetical protein